MGYSKELYHHGILGQKWGKRNGPPYPLDLKSHSASENKAGWKKSLGKPSEIDTKRKRTYTSDKPKERKRLTSDQKKKLIKIGAAVAIAGLAAYGGYKLYKNGTFDGISSIGKHASEPLLAGDASFVTGSSSSSQSEEATAYIASIQDSLEKANPYRYDPNEDNTCVPAGIAGFLRDCTKYKNAVAKGTGNKMLGTWDVLHECFDGWVEEGKDRNILQTTNAIKFSKGKSDAEQMILKRLKVNAGSEGVCAINWKKSLPDGSRAGHLFSWKVIRGKNGLEVVFKDYKEGRAGKNINHYFSGIDPNGHCLIACLDGLKPNIDAIEKYVSLE